MIFQLGDCVMTFGFIASGDNETKRMGAGACMDEFIDQTTTDGVS